MINTKTITFTEALKKQCHTSFSTIVKPVGAVCNLDCSYCYYIDKTRFYSHQKSIMSDELLENYIHQYIEANDTSIIVFSWHGGEPLLAGLDYYKKAILFQKKYGQNKEIVNTIQTNGILINLQWCQFFADNNFLIGISIDGPSDIHNGMRIDKSSEPTFDRVIKAVDLMSSYGVEYNTLSAVSHISEGRGVEIYRFLKSIGSRFIQFLPVVEYIKHGGGTSRHVIVPPATIGGRCAEWSVTGMGYGEFLNDIFDEWVTQDVGSYFVHMFDVALAQWYGEPPALCSFGETCGDSLVVEHNGDVYMCDHYVYPEYSLGNITQTSLKDMYRSGVQFDFGLSKRNSLPQVCLRCEYYFACKGECPKHRFKTVGEEYGVNILCDGFKLFFSHIDPYMTYMVDLLDKKQSPALIMPWARQRMSLL